nr:transmembrane protein 160 isoform X2 [Marmota flaviventris]
MGGPLLLSDVPCSLQAALGAGRRAAAVVRTMGGGWWWARVARLARVRFRGAQLPPQRPRSGGARGSFAPGHGPRAGASPPPVSELDRADAWLLRKAHETEATTRYKAGVWLPAEDGEAPDWRRAQPIEEKFWSDWRESLPLLVPQWPSGIWHWGHLLHAE